MSEELPTYRPRCKFLSCKSMLVYGEAFESDPDYQAGAADFWCERTSRGLGPDDDSVSLEDCSNPGRTCFQEF